MIEALQELILNWNNFIIPPMVINVLTGLMVAIVLLSMRVFKYTPSSKFRYSKLIFHSGAVTFLLAIAINRFASFPPAYPPTSLIYTAAYMLFYGYILYASSQWAERSLHANKTIYPTENAESFS